MQVLKARKEVATNFVLLCQSGNMTDRLKKAYFQRPIKILYFFTTTRIQKYLT